MSNSHPEFDVSQQKLGSELRGRTRRGFLIGGVAAVTGIAGYKWLMKGEDDTGLPPAERRILDANGNIAVKYVSDSHLMPTFAPAQVTYLKANGDIGLDPSEDLRDWQIRVETGAAHGQLKLNLQDIMALPHATMVTRFCCVEGWSSVAGWTGARFSEFTKKYFPPGQRLTQYVYMATPDEEYYVGLDMPSAMHPQTLLAWELNGKPLAPEHGAPLRLVIPTKYGIKNIKRIGTIQYTDERPGDYWYEEGYDWFAGL